MSLCSQVCKIELKSFRVRFVGNIVYGLIEIALASLTVGMSLLVPISLSYLFNLMVLLVCFSFRSVNLKDLFTDLLFQKQNL